MRGANGSGYTLATLLCDRMKHPALVGRAASDGWTGTVDPKKLCTIVWVESSKPPGVLSWITRHCAFCVRASSILREM